MIKLNKEKILFLFGKNFLNFIEKKEDGSYIFAEILRDSLGNESNLFIILILKKDINNIQFETEHISHFSLENLLDNFKENEFEFYIVDKNNTIFASNK